MDNEHCTCHTRFNVTSVLAINFDTFALFQAVAGPVGALLSTFLLQKLHSYGLFIFSGCLSLLCKYTQLNHNGIIFTR